MDRGLVTLIGMSIAYAASFIGLGLAWWAWRRRVEDPDAGREAGEDDPRGDDQENGAPPLRGRSRDRTRDEAGDDSGDSQRSEPGNAPGGTGPGGGSGGGRP